MHGFVALVSKAMHTPRGALIIQLLKIMPVLTVAQMMRVGNENLGLFLGVVTALLTAVPVVMRYFYPENRGLGDVMDGIQVVAALWATKEFIRAAMLLKAFHSDIFGNTSYFAKKSSTTKKNHS